MQIFSAQRGINHFISILAEDFADCKTKLHNAGYPTESIDSHYRRNFRLSSSEQLLELDDLLSVIRPQSGWLYYNIADILDEDDAANDSDPIKLEIIPLQEVEKFGGSSYDWMIFLCHKLAEFLSRNVDEEYSFDHLRNNPTGDSFTFNVDYFDSLCFHDFSVRMGFEQASQAQSHFLYEIIVTPTITIRAGVIFTSAGVCCIGITIKRVVSGLENADDVGSAVVFNQPVQPAVSPQFELAVVQTELDGSKTFLSHPISQPDSHSVLRDQVKELFPILNSQPSFEMKLFATSAANYGVYEPNYSITSDQAGVDPLGADIVKCVVEMPSFVAPMISHPVNLQEAAAIPPLVQFTQQVVADKVFEKALASLNLSRASELSIFNKLEFLIMVPAFNTLKQQTMDRLKAFEMLVGGTNPEAVVLFRLPFSCILPRGTQPACN